MLNPVAQFHKFLALRLTLETLNFFDNFFEEGNHVVGDEGSDGVLIETKFFLLFSKGVGDFDEEGHGGEFLHELEGFFEYFVVHGVLEFEDFF